MKKIVSILLTLAVMMGLLAGCGSGGAQDSNPPSNSTQNGGEQAPAGNEGGEAVSDLKGDLVFAIWDINLLEYIEANDMEA